MLRSRRCASSMLLSLSTLLPAAVWVVMSGLLLTVGDVLFRFGVGTHSGLLFAGAYVVYAVGVFSMTMSFFGQNIALATLAAILVNVIGITIVSLWYFGDEISLMQWAGIALGIAALFMLETHY